MFAALMRVTSSVLYGDLLEAVKADDFERVTQLLKMGEDPNLLSRYRSHTPLHIALAYSRVDCAILLLEHKADPNMHSELWDNGGSSLHFAVKTRNICFIRLLLFFSADQTLKNQFNREATDLSISNKGINLFMKTLSQQITFLKETLKHGDECATNQNWNEAIKYYQTASDIYEKQAQEELEGTYDALYENRKKANNTALVRYFYKKALNCLQSAECAYTELMTQKTLSEDEKNSYLDLLQKITMLCKSINEPQESYAEKIAKLIIEDQKIQQPAHVSDSSSSSSYPEKDFLLKSLLPQESFKGLRKRKNFPSQSLVRNDEVNEPLLSRNDSEKQKAYNTSKL